VKNATSATTKSSKTVNIIARYEIKKSRDFRPLVGHVAYLVRSSDGKTEYCTTLVNGHATGCTCPARKPCYHMKQLETIEAARMTKVVPIVSAECPANDSNVTTVCPEDEVAERWIKEELSTPLPREAFVALFLDPCWV
jgi:hypothetical protein